MTDDLVKDLREFADDGFPELSIAAADRIETLTAEVGEARKEHEGWQSAAVKLMEQVEALTAERDRFQRAFAAQSAKLQIALDVGGETVRAAVITEGFRHD
jgi:hypothetical protein